MKHSIGFLIIRLITKYHQVKNHYKTKNRSLIDFFSGYGSIYLQKYLQNGFSLETKLSDRVTGASFFLLFSFLPFFLTMPDHRQSSTSSNSHIPVPHPFAD